MTAVDRPRYQDLLWIIEPAPVGEGFVISRFRGEEQVYRSGRDSRRSSGEFFSLESMLSRTGPGRPRWTRSRVPASEAREAGVRLWESLPPSAHQSLNQSLVMSKSVELPVRLKICSPVPAVSDLPWEWLSNGQEPSIALRSGIRLARSVPLRLPVPALSVTAPLRVLVVVPNPVGERLNLDREIAAVAGGIKAAEYRLQVAKEPTIAGLRRILDADPPDVLHYIGHAGLSHGEGNVILQDQDAASYWLSATALSELLPPSVRLLCLSTCFTADNYQITGLHRLAQAPSLLKLPTTVANQYPVGEQAVREFWRVFYQALLDEEGNVNEAVTLARRAAAGADLSFADWASFTMVLRDQSGVSFALRRAGAHPAKQAEEIQAQFAVRLANDLAEQVEAFGEDAPPGLREQYQAETRRASGLLKALAEERA